MRQGEINRQVRYCLRRTALLHVARMGLVHRPTRADHRCSHSDETSVPQEATASVFKDVKNSVVVKADAAEGKSVKPIFGEPRPHSDTSPGSTTRKSGRLATAVDKTETANKNERPEKPGTKGTRSSRENVVVAPVTRPRSLSPDELNAIQMMLLFQDIPPRTADPRK